MIKQFELTAEAWSDFKDFIKNIKDKDKYIIEVKNKTRSYQQLKYYFGSVLPAILYFIRDEIKINNKDTLHLYLKEFYCFENKQEYFKPVLINNKTRYINTFSIDFERCSQNEINLYLSFVENNLDKLVTITAGSFEDLVYEFSKIENIRD